MRKIHLTCDDCGKALTIETDYQTKDIWIPVCSCGGEKYTPKEKDFVMKKVKIIDDLMPTSKSTPTAAVDQAEELGKIPHKRTKVAGSKR